MIQVAGQQKTVEDSAPHSAARASSFAGTCPLCQDQARPLFRKYDVWIQECRSCSHRYAEPETALPEHVATQYGDEYFFGGGAGYNDYLSEARLLSAHGRRYARLLSTFTRPGKILDVGAAAGFVLQEFARAGWDAHGVEPNASMARFARERLQLDVVCGTLEDMQDRSCSFDVVSMIQVVAHLAEPHVAASRVSELVSRGGLCLIETWNVRSWSARLFGQNWHEYSPPSVLQWYSPETLTQLFRGHGFELVAQGRPSKRISIGHARSLLEHGAQSSLTARLAARFLNCLPDRLTLPYPSEDLFWAVYRRC